MAEVTAARPDGRLEISGPGGTRVLTGEVVVGADGVGSTVRTLVTNGRPG